MAAFFVWLEQLAASGHATARFSPSEKRSGRWPIVASRAGAPKGRDGANPTSTANDTSLAATRAAIGGIGSRGRRAHRSQKAADVG